MKTSKTVSVIIPCRNEEKFISNCIDSIINQDYPFNLIEIIVVDGDSDDSTINILNKYKNIIVLQNKKRIVPISMNMGINIAKGDYIIRIDAHCEYPVNYISKLIEYSIKYKCDNIGCVMETLPANNTNKAIAIAISVSHPLGVGNSYFRVGTEKIRYVDTVPFGCYKKKIFDEIGLYDEELIRNQDDELNARIIKNGGKIILVPQPILKYYARTTIFQLTKMFYQYGLYKPLVNNKIGRPTTLRQFAPLLLVLATLVGLTFGIYYYKILFLTFILLLCYVFLLMSCM